MKTKIFAVLMLIVATLHLNAQSGTCNLIYNGGFQSDHYSVADPFNSGMVPGWVSSHGSAAMNSRTPSSDAASPEIEADHSAFLGDIGCGIRTVNKISLQPGHKYFMALNFRNNGSVVNSTLFAALVSDESWGTPGNTLPDNGFKGLYPIGNVIVNSSHTSWTRQLFCFTAATNLADLWVYAKSNGPGLCKIGIDDIEIYEDFDFAGSPKMRYSCDMVQFLGFGRYGACASLAKLCTYRWYKLSDTTTIATTSWYDASPFVTETYILERKNACSISYDSVKVIASTKPQFTLTSDTTLCQCQTLVLTPIILNNDGNLVYSWEDGSKDIPRYVTHVGEASGFIRNLTFKVTNKISGCSTIKNIKITYSPVPHCVKREEFACEQDFPMTIETKGIGTSYSWSWSGVTTPPSGSTTEKVLEIRSAGRYVCKVTDTTGVCVYGYDTLDIKPWTARKFDLQFSEYKSCKREMVGLYGMYTFTYHMKWYRNGVYVATSDEFRTDQNGTYTAYYISPGGKCIASDSIVVAFVDPPKVNLPVLYGSFCKSAPDTLLDFIFDDTYGVDVGKITDFEWSGNGVSLRNQSATKRYYFSPSAAKCGNNQLTLKVFYTKYGINCSKEYYTNAYKVCPMDLDAVPPLCENGDDVYLHDQGDKFSNATIMGKGLYRESGTGFYKFSPKVAGAGYHYMKYFYTDKAGCSGWDSLGILVNNLPQVKIKDMGSGWCDKQLNVRAICYDAMYTGAYRITSNIIGNKNLPAGIARNTILDITIPAVADTNYWINIENDAGCVISANYQYKLSDYFKLSYDNSRCLGDGIPLTLMSDNDTVNSKTYAGNLGYFWDNEDILYVCVDSMSDNNGNIKWLKEFIKGNPKFAAKKIKASTVASRIFKTSGWHKLTWIGIGGCVLSDSVNMPFDCSKCNAANAQDIYITDSMEVWKDDLKMVNGNIIVQPGANLKIDNCEIIFSPNSRIIVQNASASGGGDAKPAATLVVFNSVLRGCSGWKGIEVWGSSDAYGLDGIQAQLGHDPTTELIGSNTIVKNGLPITTNSWAYAYLKNTTIEDADIGVFAGMYDVTDPMTYNPNFSGGLLFIDGCTFSNNYADIVFAPLPGVVMNTTPAGPSWNASYVVRSSFLSNKPKWEGTPMYWYGINGTQASADKSYDNVGSGNHIIDLTETQVVDINPDSIPRVRYFYFKGPGMFQISFTLSDQHPSPLKRDERIPFTIWHPMFNACSPLYGKLAVGFVSGMKNVIIGNGNNW